MHCNKCTSRGLFHKLSLVKIPTWQLLNSAQYTSPEGDTATPLGVYSVDARAAALVDPELPVPMTVDVTEVKDGGGLRGGWGGGVGGEASERR